MRGLFQKFTANLGGVTLADNPDTAAKTDGPTLSFESMVGREEDIVAQQSRLYDLAVVPHPEAGEDVSSSDALHAILFDSGRPVLIAPRTPPAVIGTRICIAWKIRAIFQNANGLVRIALHGSVQKLSNGSRSVWRNYHE